MGLEVSGVGSKWKLFVIIEVGSKWKLLVIIDREVIHQNTQSNIPQYTAKGYTTDCICRMLPTVRFFVSDGSTQAEFLRLRCESARLGTDFVYMVRVSMRHKQTNPNPTNPN